MTPNVREPNTPPGFTLVELLVVIAIIVILLALLVAGLEKALKASERSRCAANQRNIAQQLASYAVDGKGTFPNSTGASPSAANLSGSQNNIQGTGVGASGSLNAQRVCYSPEYRSSDPTTGRLNIQGAGVTQTQQTDAGTVNGRTALGLGILVVAERLPQTQLGGIAHCPSLDTSAAPANANGVAGTAKYGMDEIHAEGAGGSYWLAPAQAASRIVGGYHYRGMSYARTHGNAPIRQNLAKSGFTLTSDLFDRRYGIRFHHVSGYNAAFGDGHAELIADPDQAAETKVIGNNARHPGSGGYANDQPDAVINGFAKPGADEAVFQWMAKGK